MPLIKQGFVFEVQNLYDSEQYTRSMCAVAETGGAVGDMSSVLLRGQESHRLLVAVSIPFLIKSKDLLRCLLKNHGGLSIIFDILSDNEHKLHKEAIWSICQLADSLDVRPDSVDKNQAIDGLMFHHTARVNRSSSFFNMKLFHIEIYIRYFTFLSGQLYGKSHKAIYSDIRTGRWYNGGSLSTFTLSTLGGLFSYARG